jgi:hypothetical protein
MKTYVIETYGLTRGGVICGNMVMMRKQMYGTVGSIHAAPNRFRLKEFGGDLTFEAFHEKSIWDQGVPKEITSEPYIDNRIPFVSNNTAAAIKNVDEALKLKRTKPLLRNSNSLESALGLVITPKT